MDKKGEEQYRRRLTSKYRVEVEKRIEENRMERKTTHISVSLETFDVKKSCSFVSCFLASLVYIRNNMPVSPSLIRCVLVSLKEFIRRSVRLAFVGSKHGFWFIFAMKVSQGCKVQCLDLVSAEKGKF